MKLYKRPARPRAGNLQRLVRGYQLITAALDAELRATPWLDDRERKEISSNAMATLDILNGVLSRSIQTALAEQTDLHRLKDTELLAKFAGCQQDLLHAGDIANTMLERLHTFGHLDRQEYESLTRYWRSLARQHSILIGRYEKATE